jgi:hypothetical protein
MFEYQMVIYKVRAGSQTPGVGKRAAVNLAAFTSAFSLPVVTFRCTCHLSVPDSSRALFRIGILQLLNKGR